MKINTSSNHFLVKKSDLKDLFKIMKISLVLLFVFTFQMAAVNISAQDAVIELNTNNITVGQLIKEIEKQTDYLVVYSNREVNVNQNVNIQRSSNRVSTYLDEAFNGTDIRYEFENNYIVLAKRADKNASAISSLLKSQQQGVTVTGTIVDTDGIPVIGATIVDKSNPSHGTVTNIDGNFTLTGLSDNAVLQISYVGMVSQEVSLNGRKSINVTLESDAELLDELVVIGYGTLRKSDLTGAISSVDVNELGKRTTTNPAEALQGKVSGVNVQKAGGNAGSGVQIKIRGVKTFGDNNPLYIIDGFPGDIDNVNPQDIESMEILKDGAAAAIYGSIAANGVVLITTKRGKKGAPVVEFSSYLSQTEVSKSLELLNGPEYQKVHKLMYDNWNNYASENNKVTPPPYVTNSYNGDTDWQDEMLRNGLTQNYMIAVRGGAESSNYSVSYNRLNEKGIFLGNDFRHDNARASLNLTKGIFNLDANIGFKYSDSDQPMYSLKEMYMLSPLVPVYNYDQP